MAYYGNYASSSSSGYGQRSLSRGRFRMPGAPVSYATSSGPAASPSPGAAVDAKYGIKAPRSTAPSAMLTLVASPLAAPVRSGIPPPGAASGGESNAALALLQQMLSSSHFRGGGGARPRSASATRVRPVSAMQHMLAAKPRTLSTSRSTPRMSNSASSSAGGGAAQDGSGTTMASEALHVGHAVRATSRPRTSNARARVDTGRGPVVTSPAAASVRPGLQSQALKIDLGSASPRQPTSARDTPRGALAGLPSRGRLSLRPGDASRPAATTTAMGGGAVYVPGAPLPTVGAPLLHAAAAPAAHAPITRPATTGAVKAMPMVALKGVKKTAPLLPSLASLPPGAGPATPSSAPRTIASPTSAAAAQQRDASVSVAPGTTQGEPTVPDTPTGSTRPSSASSRVKRPAHGAGHAGVTLSSLNALLSSMNSNDANSSTPAGTRESHVVSYGGSSSAAASAWSASRPSTVASVASPSSSRRFWIDPPGGPVRAPETGAGTSSVLHGGTFVTALPHVPGVDDAAARLVWKRAAQAASDLPTVDIPTGDDLPTGSVALDAASGRPLSRAAAASRSVVRDILSRDALASPVLGAVVVPRPASATVRKPPLAPSGARDASQGDTAADSAAAQLLFASSRPQSRSSSIVLRTPAPQPLPLTIDESASPRDALPGTAGGDGGETDQDRRAAQREREMAARQRLKAFVSEAHFDMRATVDFYGFGKVLGTGSFGEVRLAWHRLAGVKVAVKTYEKARLTDPSHWKRVQQEIDVLARLNHVNSLRMLETIDTPKRIHIVTDYCSGGNLCTYVKNKGRLTESEARGIFIQLMAGIDYLHSNAVVHRDIKLENILFSDESRTVVRIVDFGFAVVVKDPNKKLRIFCGTPSYMAPEICQRREYIGKPVDVWSLGVLLYAMIVGRFPFSGKTYPDLYKRIIAGQLTFPDHMSGSARDLVRRMLNVDATRRLTLNMTATHPWVLPGVPAGLGPGAPSPAAQLLAGASGPAIAPDKTLLTSSDASNDIFEHVLLRCEQLGFARAQMISAVLSRERNACTTAYYLVLSRLGRSASAATTFTRNQAHARSGSASGVGVSRDTTALHSTGAAAPGSAAARTAHARPHSAAPVQRHATRYPASNADGASGSQNGSAADAPIAAAASVDRTELRSRASTEGMLHGVPSALMSPREFARTAVEVALPSSVDAPAAADGSSLAASPSGHLGGRLASMSGTWQPMRADVDAGLDVDAGTHASAAPMDAEGEARRRGMDAVTAVRARRPQSASPVVRVSQQARDRPKASTAWEQL